MMNAALDRIEAVLDEPELPDNGNQNLLSKAQPDKPEVQFSDVAFAYQDKEVLHNISSVSYTHLDVYKRQIPGRFRVFISGKQGL